MMYKKLDFPGVPPCALCGAAGEMWEHQETPTSAVRKVVMCSSGLADGFDTDECPLVMPPENYYRATKREAVEVWTKWRLSLRNPPMAERLAATPPRGLEPSEVTDDEILALAADHESRPVLGPAKRVSIAELEAMLNSEPQPKIELLPNGEARIEEAPEFRFRFNDPHMLGFARALLSRANGEGK